MFERFTDTARRTVVLAQEEARMLNHNYIGTEHLLLALTGDTSLAGRALTEAGITRDAARGHIIELIGEGATPTHGHIAFTLASKEILVGALRIALDCGVSYIGSEHMLLSLLANDMYAAPVSHLTITGCGANLQAVTQSLTELMAAPDAPVAGPEPRFVLSA